MYGELHLVGWLPGWLLLVLSVLLSLCDASSSGLLNLPAAAKSLSKERMFAAY